MNPESPKLFFSIQAVRTKKEIAQECEVAQDFFSRCRGLLGRKEPLRFGQGLWILPCSDIHMWGMHFSIDVLFLKKISTQKDHYQVSSVHEGLRPGKWLPVFDWGAHSVLELPFKTVFQFELKRGDLLWIRSSN